MEWHLLVECGQRPLWQFHLQQNHGTLFLGALSTFELTITWSTCLFSFLTVFSVFTLLSAATTGKSASFSQKLFTSTTTSVQVRIAGNFWTELLDELLTLNNSVEIDVGLIPFDYFMKSKALKIFSSIIITISRHWPPILPCCQAFLQKIASECSVFIKITEIQPPVQLQIRKHANGIWNRVSSELSR